MLLFSIVSYYFIIDSNSAKFKKYTMFILLSSRVRSICLHSSYIHSSCNNCLPNNYREQLPVLLIYLFQTLHFLNIITAYASALPCHVHPFCFMSDHVQTHVCVLCHKLFYIYFFQFYEIFMSENGHTHAYVIVLLYAYIFIRVIFIILDSIAYLQKSILSCTATEFSTFEIFFRSKFTLYFLH